MSLSVDGAEPPHPEVEAGLALQWPDPEPACGLLVEEQAMCQGEELLSDPLDVRVFLLRQPYPRSPFPPDERPPFPVGKQNVLVLRERRGGRLAGGDGSRGVRDIFCHRTAENGVIFDSIESVRPYIIFFRLIGPELSDRIFWLGPVLFFFVTFVCIFFLHCLLWGCIPRSVVRWVQAG